MTKKYHIEREGRKRVRLRLTAPGAAREFFAGAAVAGGAAVVGLGVFFLPDFLGKYSQREELWGPFLWTWLGLAALIGGLVGWRRAARRAWVELDAEGDAFVVQERGWLGGLTERLEASLGEVTAVELERRGWGGQQVIARFDGGGEEVLARGWFGGAELGEVAAACREVVGADDAGGAGRRGMK